MKLTKFAFAAALCALFAVQAEARTLYVDARRPNNKGNGYTAKTAKKTIQAAINKAKSGDVIVVAPGSYAPIKTNNKKIKIVALKGASKTKIVKPAKLDQKVALAQLGKSYTVYLGTDANGNWKKGSSGIWTKGARSTLEGFLLDGMNRAVGSFGELIGVSGGNAKACILQRLGKKYADTYGGFASFDYASVAVNSKLTDCIIRKNKADIAPAEYSAVGSATTSSKFLRCSISNNEGDDEGFESGSSLINCLLVGNTTRYELFSKATLLNCTIVKNNIEGRYEDPRFSYASKYYNCILWNNYVKPPKTTKKVYGYEYYDADGNWIGYRDAGTATFSISYTDALGQYASADGVTEGVLSRYCPGWTKSEDSYTDYVPGTNKRLHNVDSGNIYKYTDKTNKNPKFVGAAKNIFKLKKGSYCIDKGRLTASQKKSVGATDLAGGKRVKGKYVDRGCYEY